MRRSFTSLVFSLYCIALAVANASPGQWTTHGPSGKAIFAVVVDPSNPKIVYAAGDGGLFKSTDEGTTWTLLHVGSHDIWTVRLLVIDPQHPQCIYAGGRSEVGGGGLFKSTDGGETWSLLPTPARLRALVIDPQHPTVLYGGFFKEDFFKSGDGGMIWTREALFKSEDGGMNWAMVIGARPPGGTSLSIEMSAFVLDPMNPAILYAGALDGGVLKSTDGGTTWINILEAGDNGADNGRDLRIYSTNAIAVAPTQPATLYVSTQGRGILKSTDGGTEWQELDRGLLYLLAVAIDPTTPATLYATTYDDVFMSTDSGKHWQSLQLPSVTPPGINASTVNPTGTTVYVGTNNGVSVYQALLHEDLSEQAVSFAEPP